MANSIIKGFKSKYRYVEIVDVSGRISYLVNMQGVSKDTFATERAAAIAADEILIKIRVGTAEARRKHRGSVRQGQGIF